MGQKTNPIGMRLGIIKTWDSRWFARKDYAKLLEEDIFIRKYLKKRLSQAGISRIVIQRAPRRMRFPTTFFRRIAFATSYPSSPSRSTWSD